MPVIMIDALLASLVAGAGIVAGWWLRSLLAGGKSKTQDPSEEPLDAQAAVSSQDLSRAILTQLHEIASHMAVDVRHHDSQVQKITDDLKNSGDISAENVYAAVNKLIEENEILGRKLEAVEDRLGEQQRQLETQAVEARTDVLTKLHNRRAFDDELDLARAAFHRDGTPLSLMLLDIDHFKRVNDTFGHQAGDEVLRGIAQVLKESAGETEIAARYGGEEFAMIYPGASIEQIKHRAEATRAAIAQATFHFEGIDLCATASAGIAQLLPGENLGALMRRADGGLYASKNAGRDCGHWNDGMVNHPLSGLPTEERVQQNGYERCVNEETSPAITVDRQFEHDPAMNQAAQVEPELAGQTADPQPVHAACDQIESGQLKTIQPLDEGPPARSTEESESLVEPDSSDQIDVSPAGQEPGVPVAEEAPEIELPGRVAFREEVIRRVAEWKRGGASATVVMMEIDKYHQLVDRHGDELELVLIRATAQFLKAIMRDMDHVARFDNDKFAMLLPGTELSQAIQIAERLRLGIERCQLPVGDRQLQFTVSMGIAQVSENDEASDLLQRARASLSAASAGGGNSSYYFDGVGPERAAAPQAILPQVL